MTAARDTQPLVKVAAEPPQGWFDKTMIVYSAPPEPGRAMSPNMVISRDALLEAETFREYCNRQIETFRSNLPNFQRESEGYGRSHERDAFQIQFTWRSAAGLLRQRVFFISAGPEVVVTYAVTAAADDFADHEQAFERGLASLRIDAPPSPGQRAH
ncbi:hypothetical protein C5708_04330 [Caulobacter sp. CCUG 60055]|uniref:DcrB-related protein n=1 Tax=Caulobacter sp. CCUG 60055 TaxID=2100090 RepID=UPI001FA7FD2C|nr:DcrB-related protein [Caulobacter sp. CCUG 60055]MBQ1542672.1 DcrB-related protein [Caulobacteraceae bacterium]MCI3179475.1 hypothetical protein [Caulobacter sp. CCUG 60055]